MNATAPFAAGAIAILVATSPAPERYAVSRSGDVVQLRDASTHTVVSILPSIGNIAFEMQVNGTNILWWPFASTDAFKSRPAMSGIPFLGPWANRLDEPAFYANGRRHPFDMSLGNIRGGAIPIHGFITTTSAWRVVETRADDRSAWTTSRLDFGSQPEWMKQWPFAHAIEMTHRLQNGALEVETRITNTGAEPMPIAIGFHPYFRLTDAPRAEWTFSIGARTHWLLASNKIPTGETEPIERLIEPGTPRLRDYNLDDVFSDLVRDARGRATMRVAGRSQRIDVELGPSYHAAVVWAPNPADTGRGSQRLAGPPNPVDRGDFICFEPMAGITDALNLAQRGVYRELQYVAPGQQWRESFWIRPSGF